MSARGDSLGGLIIVALAVLWWSTRGPGSEHSVTMYWLDADNHKIAQEIYSVDRSSSSVAYVMKDPEAGRLFLGPYKDCAVIDDRNWDCSSAGYQAIDGKVTGSPFDTDKRVHAVSAIRYWFAPATKPNKKAGK